MGRIRSHLVLGVAVALVWGCAGPGTSTAPGGGSSIQCGRTHELKFKIKQDGCVEKVNRKGGDDASTVNVCRNDVVKWKVKVDGPNGDKKKKVIFDKGTDSPFTWIDSGFRGDWIIGMVKSDAVLDKPYEYSVVTQFASGDGCPLDPMIIVRR
jgi:hypothetical protein